MKLGLLGIAIAFPAVKVVTRRRRTPGKPHRPVRFSLPPHFGQTDFADYDFTDLYPI